MKLDNIPAAANGWKVFCRYSNSYGTTDSDKATITVTDNPPPAPQTGYTGDFHDSIAGRGTMTVTATGSLYSVTVSWPDSAFKRNIWKFSGTIDANGVMLYTGCTKTTITFDGTGKETTVVVYNDGTGILEFSQKDNGYYWTSVKPEDAINRSLFVRTIYQ